MRKNVIKWNSFGRKQNIEHYGSLCNFIVDFDYECDSEVHDNVFSEFYPIKAIKVVNRILLAIKLSQIKGGAPDLNFRTFSD